MRSRGNHAQDVLGSPAQEQPLLQGNAHHPGSLGPHGGQLLGGIRKDVDRHPHAPGQEGRDAVEEGLVGSREDDEEVGVAEPGVVPPRQRTKEDHGQNVIG